MSEKTIAEHVAENPKLAGALFTVCLLLMQAGNAAAGSAIVQPGP